MRSTKDLKGIVSEARGRKSTPINPIQEEGERAGRRISSMQTPTAQTEEYNFVKNQRVGGANYQSAVPTDEDTLKKLRKLEVLAQSDKETIEAQTKKMHGMRAEMEQLKQKYG